MKEFIITVVGVCLFGGIIELLSPEGEGGGIKKHMKLLASLCVLTVISAPLVSFCRALSNTDAESITDLFEIEHYENKYDEIFNESISRYTAEELGRICEERVMVALGIKEEDVDIEVVTENIDGVISVNSARIIIYPSAIAHDPRDIKAIVENMLECECEIIYD